MSYHVQYRTLDGWTTVPSRADPLATTEPDRPSVFDDRDRASRVARRVAAVRTVGEVVRVYDTRRREVVAAFERLATNGNPWADPIRSVPAERAR